eukprot:c6212_g1_i1.p1 GENE.c6212_g1_i1~~c6212_g1_i1.p1  ORF type:complete len:305 (+),score=32.28 c6212_g1_i1:45-959(+)
MASTKGYIARTLIGVALCFGSSFINALCAVLAGFRTPNIKVYDLDQNVLLYRGLPDFGHDLVAILKTHIGVYLTPIASQFTTVDLNGVFLDIFGFPMIYLGFLHPQRTMLLRRVPFIFSCINILRAISISVTSLPDASPECHIQFETPSGEYKRAAMFPISFGRALRVMFDPSNNITCGDMIISGHTVFLLLSIMVFRRYFQASSCPCPFPRFISKGVWSRFLFLLRWWHYIGCTIGIHTIVITRLHYTVDVVLAIAITLAAWFIYHTCADFPQVRQQSSFMLWYESDATQITDSQYIEQSKED